MTHSGRQSFSCFCYLRIAIKGCNVLTVLLIFFFIRIEERENDTVSHDIKIT